MASLSKSSKASPVERGRAKCNKRCPNGTQWYKLTRVVNINVMLFEIKLKPCRNRLIVAYWRGRHLVFSKLRASSAMYIYRVLFVMAEKKAPAREL